MCEAMSFFGAAEPRRGLPKTRRPLALVNSDKMAFVLLLLCVSMPSLVESRMLSSNANADFAALLQARVQSGAPKSVFITRKTTLDVMSFTVRTHSFYPHYFDPLPVPFASLLHMSSSKYDQDLNNYQFIPSLSADGKDCC